MPYKYGKIGICNFKKLRGNIFDEKIIVNYVKTDSEKGSTWWWTRTPGSDSMNAALIAAGGILYNAGDSVDNAFAVRPAMWIIIK